MHFLSLILVIGLDSRYKRGQGVIVHDKLIRSCDKNGKDIPLHLFVRLSFGVHFTASCCWYYSWTSTSLYLVVGFVRWRPLHCIQLFVFVRWRPLHCICLFVCSFVGFHFTWWYLRPLVVCSTSSQHCTPSDLATELAHFVCLPQTFNAHLTVDFTSSAFLSWLASPCDIELA